MTRLVLVTIITSYSAIIRIVNDVHHDYKRRVRGRQVFHHE